MKSYGLGMLFAACVAMLGGALTASAAEPAAPPAGKAAVKAVPDQATLEKEFAEMLSGATLVGSFTDSAAPVGKLTQEKYTLESVSKLKEGVWLFKTRIQYADHDLTVPLPLEVKWAGDTPMVTLTDMNVPGLGKFTARVLFFRGQYCGTWSGATHGGHLFGKIEKPAKAGAAEKK